MTLWDFALASWRKPAVSEACLALQDQYGQSVALLLWGAWAEAEGRCLTSGERGRAVDVARVWENDVIGHLRAARRALTRRLETADAAVKRLAEATRRAEMEAERALMSALEPLAPAPGAANAPDPDPSLAILMGMWSQERVQVAALALAATMTTRETLPSER